MSGRGTRRHRCRRSRALEERLGQADGVLADGGMNIVEREIEHLWRHGGESVQGAQGLQSSFGMRAFGGQVFQRLNRPFVVALEEQSLRGVALPAVGTVQGSHQAGGFQMIEAWDFAQLRPRRIDTINAAFVMAGTKVQVVLDVVGDPFRVFDHEAVHVGHIERAIGAGFEHGRTKPVIGRSEELAFFLIGSPMAGEGDAVGFQDLAMNEVIDRFADENAGGKGRAEQAVAIRRGAVGGGHMPDGADLVEALQRPADGENSGGVTVVGQGAFVRWYGQMWIAGEVVFRQEVMPKPGGVVVSEPVAPVIAVPAKLGFARLRFEGAVGGAKTEVATADVHRFWSAPVLWRFPSRSYFPVWVGIAKIQSARGLAHSKTFRQSMNGADSAAAVAVGAVEPVVEAVIEAVDPMLLVAFAKTGEKSHPFVRFAIAVGVLRIKDFWRGADDDALAPGDYAGGEVQSFEKHGGLVVDAILIGVFQNTDDAAGFAFAVHAERIVAHLHYPQLSIGAPLEGDGVLNQRFGGDQPDFETWPNADRLEGIRRGEWRRLESGEQSVKGPALDLVWQSCGVLVLHPKLAAVKPGPIVTAVAGYHRNLATLPPPAQKHFPGPAGAEPEIGLGDEQVQRKGFLV